MKCNRENSINSYCVAEKIALIFIVLFNLLIEFAGFVFILVMVLKYPDCFARFGRENNVNFYCVAKKIALIYCLIGYTEFTESFLLVLQC